jgi:hypothetical protein
VICAFERPSPCGEGDKREHKSLYMVAGERRRRLLPFVPVGRRLHRRLKTRRRVG